MKGLRRTDQTQLVELLKRNAPKEMISAVEMGQLSSLATASPEEKGHIKKLEKLIKKRLPN